MTTLPLLATDYQTQLQSTFLAALADNTQRTYQAALNTCTREGLVIPATPLAISQYLHHAHVWRKAQGGTWARSEQLCSIATLQTHLAALSAAHTFLGLPDPCQDALVKTTLMALKKQRGTAQKMAQPLTRERILTLLPVARNHSNVIQATRDCALLLIGYTGAFRRAELVALTVSDLVFNQEGVVITIQRSKTDPNGQGRTLAIPCARGDICPVQALRTWLTMADIQQGAVFRRVFSSGKVGAQLTAHGFNYRIKQLATAAGLDSTLFSAHSLRAGFCTSAAQMGVESWKIRQQTGHQTETMLMRYIRAARLFADNPAATMW